MPTAIAAGMLSSARLGRRFGLRAGSPRPLRRRRSWCSLARSGAGAQVYETMQPMATRGDLTALADRLERGSESAGRASALRARLREGDSGPATGSR